jgi:hypothetical protein
VLSGLRNRRCSGSTAQHLPLQASGLWRAKDRCRFTKFGCELERSKVPSLIIQVVPQDFWRLWPTDPHADRILGSLRLPFLAPKVNLHSDLRFASQGSRGSSPAKAAAELCDLLEVLMLSSGLERYFTSDNGHLGGRGSSDEKLDTTATSGSQRLKERDR